MFTSCHLIKLMFFIIIQKYKYGYICGSNHTVYSPFSVGHHYPLDGSSAASIGFFSDCNINPFDAVYHSFARPDLVHHLQVLEAGILACQAREKRRYLRSYYITLPDTVGFGSFADFFIYRRFFIANNASFPHYGFGMDNSLPLLHFFCLSGRVVLSILSARQKEGNELGRNPGIDFVCHFIFTLSFKLGPMGIFKRSSLRRASWFYVS